MNIYNLEEAEGQNLTVHSLPGGFIKYLLHAHDGAECLEKKYKTVATMSRSLWLVEGEKYLYTAR